jgi:transposase-like protein
LLPAKQRKRGYETTSTDLSWSLAKERLLKHHGVPKARFPLYLKELEFWYNHRTGDLLDHVANYLCDLVPKQD